ncbi:MAG: OmpP1/FadL family transporter, partial [Alphaproteobacteria bacterium]
GGVPTQNDGTSKAKGDDWGFGYNLGLLFEPIAGTRIGVAYRSKVSHELDGSVRFNTGGPVGAGISGATGQFIDTGAKASVTLPEIVSFGIHQDINAQWSVMAEGSWTRWSRFDELRFRFENPLQADSVTDEDWHNAWFGALGATYRATNGWTFRGGVAFDESPIPDRTRTPRLPGSDRYWIAIGAKKSLLPNLDLDVGYTHIFLDDATVGLTTGGTGNTFRGNLSGEYDSSIDIFTLQVTYRF